MQNFRVKEEKFFSTSLNHREPSVLSSFEIIYRFSFDLCFYTFLVSTSYWKSGIQKLELSLPATFGSH